MLGSLTIVVAHHMYSMPPYPYLATDYGTPPPAGSEKVVLKFRSVNNMVIAPAPFSRSYGVIFAEFLRHGSLKRPSILYLFTCVGLGYGQFTGRIALPIRSFFLEA
ncbi:Photosystem I P700 chlorophyll a apoprotein A1 (Fragment) [Linum grandiflorum]